MPAAPELAELLAAVRVAWEAGLQPRDGARLFPASSQPARALYVDLVALDRAGWHRLAAPQWFEQADELGARAEPWWRTGEPYWPQFLRRHGTGPAHAMAVANLVLHTLADQPRLPLVEPPPWLPDPALASSEPSDARMLAKIRALLAKAESSTFEDEAEALSAKAQELIARHSIDLALLADAHDVPCGRRLYLEPPYVRPKVMLLGAVCAANQCRSVWNEPTKTAFLFGHRGDLHLAEVLFTSLLAQGTAAMLAGGSHHDGWANRTRSWRNAFWYGYATRIGERLRAATSAARHSAEADHRSDLLPLLASRREAVDRAVDAAFPHLGRLRVSVSNGDGVMAGRRFADRASLSGDRGLASRRRGLPPGVR